MSEFSIQFIISFVITFLVVIFHVLLTPDLLITIPGETNMIDILPLKMRTTPLIIHALIFGGFTYVIVFAVSYTLTKLA